MKDITFLMLHLNYGGLEKQTITLINNLAKTKKYNINIISVYDILNGKSFYNIDDSVEIRFLANFGPDHKKIKEAKEKKQIFKLIKYLFLGIKCNWYKNVKLKSVIKSLKTDVIFSTRIEFSNLIKRSDTINISQEHSYIDTSKYISKVRKSFKSIKYIVVMTDKAKSQYETWIKDFNNYSKVIKIPNMIENSFDLISNLDKKQIVSIGRLEEEKDYNTLIDVFEIVNKEVSDVKLKIIGDGRQKEELEQKVKRLGLEDNVIFTGRLEEDKIKEEFLNSTICVSSSKRESFSLILVEAMSFGVVPVSFNIDVGPKEIIENEKNGYLIEDRNINAMAEKIIFLLKNDDMLKTISNNAKDESKKYFAENILQKWEEII